MKFFLCFCTLICQIPRHCRGKYKLRNKFRSTMFAAVYYQCSFRNLLFCFVLNCTNCPWPYEQWKTNYQTMTLKNIEHKKLFASNYREKGWVWNDNIQRSVCRETSKRPRNSWNSFSFYELWIVYLRSWIFWKKSCFWLNLSNNEM